MIKSLFEPAFQNIALIRSLTSSQLWHVLALVLISTILPMLLAFGCISLVFEYFGIQSFSIWSLLPVIMVCSVSKMGFFAKKIKEQAAQASHS